MSFLDLFFISVGLAMDAFAVSLTSCFMVKDLKVSHILKIGLFFGFFQFIMPVIGWLAGINFSKYVEALGHWIAFLLLGFIGVKMIYEALRNKNNDYCDNNKDSISNKLLLVLALATSIDALAVGVSLAAFGQEALVMLQAALTIGVITFIISIIGVFLGKKFGSLFQKQAEIAGGIILIIIGSKILIEHLI